MVKLIGLTNNISNYLFCNKIFLFANLLSFFGEKAVQLSYLAWLCILLKERQALVKFLDALAVLVCVYRLVDWFLLFLSIHSKTPLSLFLIVWKANSGAQKSTKMTATQIGAYLV